jgi:hypothetical protein
MRGLGIVDAWRIMRKERRGCPPQNKQPPAVVSSLVEGEARVVLEATRVTHIMVAVWIRRNAE